ncbi:MAG: hypothetical protein JW939_08885, partial [Candidatus Thermoplasmatota archaeon]|nr:hypothetical protein [Candidatus Thermoplasmatota archaeon]
MTEPSTDIFPSEDIVFRLRAKMEDNSYTIVSEGDRRLLAFRVPGEKIDLLRSLEYLSEFLDQESVERVEKVLMISDREFEVSPGSIIKPKMDVKKADDDRLFEELSSKLSERMQPLVFTEENDILEIYRVALRMDGSVSRTDISVGLDLLKVSLPSEGEVIYLIFDDGYRKLSRSNFEKLTEGAMQGLREGPSLASDPAQKGLARSTSLSAPSTNNGSHGEKDRALKGTVNEPIVDNRAPFMDDPRVLLRELSKNLAPLRYRKDNIFSRPDVNQLFFVCMSGPALFVKIIEDKDELPLFLRVLEHRSDALGIL